jgi:hypothetical protein
MQSDEIRNAWQTQGSGAAPPTLEELRKKGEKFRSTIAKRNRREYVAMALMIPYFSYLAWTARPLLMRVGNGLIVAALVYIAYQLHRRTAISSGPGESSWQTCLAFHRAELVRQRDALRGVWKWYLGPLLPGIAAIEASFCMANFRKSGRAGLVSLVWPGIMALIVWWIGRLNLRKGAASIQRQIDELEMLR